MNTKGKSVLIVEDDAKIRQLVKMYLEREGYEALEAENGEDALEKCKQFDPCLVILDLMLPGLSGEQVCTTIRKDLKSNVPIIMLTAKVEETERIQGLRMGADDYVTKPFSPQELVTRVEVVLRQSQPDIDQGTNCRRTLSESGKNCYGKNRRRAYRQTTGKA